MWPNTCWRFSWLTQIKMLGAAGGGQPTAEFFPGGEKPAPLTGQEVDHVEVLRRRLQMAGLRGEEVDVGVPRIEPALLHVEGAADLQGQMALPGLDLHPAPQRDVLETARHLHQHRAYGQVDLTGSVNVGVGGAAHLAVAAQILEPGLVDVGLVSVRRQVGPMGGAKVDPGAHRAPRVAILHPHVHPLLAPGGDDLHPHISAPLHALFHHLSPAHCCGYLLPSPHLQSAPGRAVDLHVTPFLDRLPAAAPTAFVGGQKIRSGNKEGVLPGHHPALHLHLDPRAFRSTTLQVHGYFAARQPGQRIVFLAAQGNRPQGQGRAARSRHLYGLDGPVRLRILPVEEPPSLEIVAVIGAHTGLHPAIGAAAGIDGVGMVFAAVAAQEG